MVSLFFTAISEYADDRKKYFTQYFFTLLAFKIAKRLSLKFRTKYPFLIYTKIACKLVDYKQNLCRAVLIIGVYVKILPQYKKYRKSFIFYQGFYQYSKSSIRNHRPQAVYSHST